MSRRSKNKYVKAYDQKEYNKDDKIFNESIKNGKPDFSAFKRLMISDLCTNTPIIDNGCIGDIKLEDVQHALRYPKQNWIGSKT